MTEERRTFSDSRHVPNASSRPIALRAFKGELEGDRIMRDDRGLRR